MKYTGSDPYLDENRVLKNKLGIKDQDTLDKVERDITSYKISLLDKDPIKGKFNLAHLKAIHKHLFSDIYPWAGKIRDGYLQKGEQDFMMGYRIVPESQKLFQQLKDEKFLKHTEPDKIAERLAYYMGEINVIHPFREGNGRTQRIFIAQLAREAGYELNFKNVTQQEMIDASIQVHKLNYKPLENLIRIGLSKSEKAPSERYKEAKKQLLSEKGKGVVKDKVIER